MLNFVLKIFSTHGVLASILLTATIVEAASSPLNTEGLCGKKTYYQEIRSLWQGVKPEYEKWIKNSAEKPYSLYNIQTETNNLLKYGGHCLDIYILDELAELYLGALTTLKESDTYLYYYYPGSFSRISTHKLTKKYPMWLDKEDKESILVSSQFLYLISESLDILSKIQPEQQTTAIKNMLTEYPAILQAHYERWVFDSPGPFEVRGWGCKTNGKHVKSGMNHQEFIVKKLQRSLGDQKSPSYCNAVTDTDMWIIAGVVNFLSYQQNIQTSSILPEKYSSYLEYTQSGMQLLKDRVTYKKLLDWNGELVVGANFDLGIWDDHPGYDYAGYEGTEYPTQFIETDVKFKPKNIGWDISHARRFVHVFGTFNEKSAIIGADFFDDAFMEKLSNQFLYGTFNGDFSQPAFTNFMNGADGWYRVGYEKRIGFGYGPGDMSIAALTGGYGFWIRYNDQYEKLYNALVKMICSDDLTVQEHLKGQYGKHFWKNCKKFQSIIFQKKAIHIETMRILIQFFPSLCFSASSLFLPEL